MSNTPLGMFPYIEANLGDIQGPIQDFQRRVEVQIAGLAAGGTGLADPGASGIVVRVAVNTTVARAIDSTASIAVVNGDMTGGNAALSIVDNVTLPGTGGFTPPTGTTAQRPGSPGNIIRFNSTTGKFEAWEASTWKNVIGGGTVAISQLEHIATNSLLGRDTASVGPVEVLSSLPIEIQDSITHVSSVVAGEWEASKVEAGYGGTGHSIVDQGDLLYGAIAGSPDDGFIRDMAGNIIQDMAGVNISSMAGPTTGQGWNRLAKNSNATRYLANTGASNNPSWDQINLANGVIGTLPTSQGGTGQTTYTNGQLLIGNIGGTLTKATLTQTANQVLVTNASGSITLSTPQDIGVGSFVQFGKLGLGGVATHILYVQGGDAEGAMARFSRDAGGPEKDFYIGSTNNLRVNLSSEGEFRIRVGVTANLPYSTGFDSVTVSAAGNVGISSAVFSPASKLCVDGGVHIGGESDAGDNNLLVDGNINVSGFIGHPSYVSQTTGWRIDNLGGADFRSLFADELIVKSFIVDLEQALAGGQIITKSVGILGADFNAPAAGLTATLTMKDLPSASNMQIFETLTDGGLGDWVRIRNISRAGGGLIVTDCWGRVTNYLDQVGGLQTYTFTRGSGVNAGNMPTFPAAGSTVAADAVILDYGISGNGFYEVSAIDGVYGINSPYAQIVTWSGASPIAANQTLRTRFGNLRGITNITGEFGIIAGTFAASNGQFMRASNQAFELHGIDLLMWDSVTGFNVIKIDRTFPSLAIGSPAPGNYSSGTGIWMGKDSGAYKFRVGVPGDRGLFWDGTTMTVAGWTVNAASISSGGIVLAASATPSANRIYIGTGAFANTNTSFYVDGLGQFSLKNKLTWDGTTLGIDGSGLFSGSVRANALYIGNFDNLAEDPGIERGGSTWILGAGMTIVNNASSSHAGSWYINSLTINQVAENANFVDCKPGDIFYCEGWCAATGSQPASVFIRWYNTSKTLLSAAIGSGVFGGFGVYVLSQLTATAPANAAYARCGFQSGAAVPGWFFDDIYFRRVVDSVIIKDGAITAQKISVTQLSAITATMGALTVNEKLTMTGNTSAITIGDPVVAAIPTSATVGTGIWIDRTGMYGLLTNVQQAKFLASGKITAGVDSVQLDVNGITIKSAAFFSDARAYTHVNSTGAVISSFGGFVDATLNLGRLMVHPMASRDSNMYLHCDAATGKQPTIFMESRINGATQMRMRMAATAVDFGSPPRFIISSQNVGVGDITFWGGSAQNVLGIINGVEPTGGASDTLLLYSVDLSAGNATLGMRVERAVVAAAAGASDAYLDIRINGVTYKLLLHT